MSQVDFDLFEICAAYKVDERALAGTLKALISVGKTPCSIEDLSELAQYSPRHMHRILQVLRYSTNSIPPIVISRDGKRGRGNRSRFDVDLQRAHYLGLLQNAA